MMGLVNMLCPVTEVGPLGWEYRDAACVANAMVWPAFAPLLLVLLFAVVWGLWPR